MTSTLSQTRRRIIGAVTAFPTLALCLKASAASGLELLTNADATAGVREALSRGANIAVDTLGATDGFLGNPAIRIPLPPSLQKIESAFRFAGMQAQADALVVSMNRAAEQATALAKPLLLNAIKSMTVSDAKSILAGGETSVTEFFQTKTRDPLTEKFLPIVKKQTAQVGLARQYNDLAGQGAKFGLVDANDANVERYVTLKALDALYATIGQQERSIRQNPVGAGSAILGKVFGALR